MSKLMSRRQFIHTAGAVGASAILGSAPVTFGCSLVPEKQRKLIVVLFGGGIRSSESIDDPQHRWIPRLWTEMIPKGTLFTNMRIEGKVVHPNSAGSIVTGHWEWDDIDWSRPVAHPTIYEIYRKAHAATDTSAWAFVYASILANTGVSRADGYGLDYAANVVEPPTISRAAAEQMDKLMQQSDVFGSSEAQLQAARHCADLARSSSRIALGGLRSPQARSFIESEYAVWKKSDATTSHDAFLTDRAMACMKTFSPNVITVAFGEIDCAHYGSWSRYVEAIRRTDELTHKLWKAAEEIEAYKNQTLMLILPDHGRELDSPNGPGFVHHSDFYTNTGADEGCRRVWMLALGPRVAPSRKIAKPIPVTAAAATGLEYLNLDCSDGSEKSVWKYIL
jgi:hypothetical protein